VIETFVIVWNSKYLETTTFRKLDLFPPSNEERETPTQLGLSRANFDQCPVILCVVHHRQNPLDPTGFLAA
jgi:hypothetical protein